MCGYLAHFRFEDTIAESEFSEKLSLLDHRGPDYSGISSPLSASHAQVLLGHTRLSIIDLTQDGRQPFVSDCGGMHLIYNGEVYNYIEIRKELIDLGVRFNTDTDTEVFLKAFLTWGHDCYKKFVGMFSALIFDETKNEVILVRDAFGIKPIFYCMENGSLYVASEVGPLIKSIKGETQPNPGVVFQYLIHGAYDANCDTFFQGIKTLPPAAYLHLDLSDLRDFSPVTWWSPSIETSFSGTYEDATNKLRRLFLKSLSFHLRSDVPVGIQLSGGLDSTAILWGVKKVTRTDEISSFSYVPKDKQFSEEYWIDVAADGSGIASKKISTTAKELADGLPKLIQAQGEPFGSAGTFADFCVLEEMRRQGFVVALAGQGADELLGGYEGYPGEKVISLIERGLFISCLKFILSWSKRNKKSILLPLFFAIKYVSPDLLLRIVRLLTGRRNRPNWLKFDQVQSFNKRISKTPEIRLRWKSGNIGNRIKERLRWTLTNLTLPSLLRHGDRNSMAHSVESRVPFLTIELFEFVYSLPEDYLVSQNARTKNIFRDALIGIVPEKIINRRDKVGYEAGSKLWKGMYLKFIKNYHFTSNISKVIDFENLDALSEKQLWRIMNFLFWAEEIWGHKKEEIEY